MTDWQFFVQLMRVMAWLDVAFVVLVIVVCVLLAPWFSRHKGEKNKCQ